MKPRISKESLFNYFVGQATVLQKQQIDEWVKEEENREFFFECLASWETRHMQFSADPNEAFQRHQQRMASRVVAGNNGPVPVKPRDNHVVRLSWFGGLIAATITAVILFTGVYLKDYLYYTSYRTAFGETRTLVLSDGSRVTLNANSFLQVPRLGFGEKTRKVILNGEADFTVKHLPGHQKFIVQTDKHFEVVVLGTEFMVNTRESGQKVVLNKGKVRLLYQEGKTAKQLTMKPGNLVTFDRQGHARLKHTPKPQDYSAWKEHRLVFDGTPLAEVSTLFQEIYGIQLQFADESLLKWTVSGAFTATNADELIETMTSASNLSYQRKGDTLFIAQEP